MLTNRASLRLIGALLLSVIGCAEPLTAPEHHPRACTLTLESVENNKPPKSNVQMQNNCDAPDTSKAWMDSDGNVWIVTWTPD